MMKQLLQNQEFQLDEILFKGRNKLYGAYQLRHRSDIILTKAMLIGVGLFGLLAATPFALNALKKTPETNEKFRDIDGNRRLVILPPREVQPPAQVSVPKMVKTYNSEIPVPVKDVQKDSPLPNRMEKENAAAGTENISGPPAIAHYQPPALPGIPTSEKTVPQVSSSVAQDPNAIAKAVDIEAVFSEGIQTFRNKLVQTFNTSDFDGSGEKISTIITFVVEKDGSISNIRATGNDPKFNIEAERSIRRIKGKWSPAKVDGETVRSYFKFPVSMMFE